VSTQLQFIIIIVVVVIVGKDTISFMQGIYTYIPETNHVPKQYNVAAILSLLFMVPISLAAALAVMYFYISNINISPIWQFSVVPYCYFIIIIII
jgi:hypothetical protein